VAVLGENLDPFRRLRFLFCGHFRIPEEENEPKIWDKESKFRFLSWPGEVAHSVSRPPVAAEVVEDRVEDTEEASVEAVEATMVADVVVELQETDRLLSVQMTRHNSRTGLRMYDNATKLTKNSAFIASPMAQNERAG
jgi:hypothetical protein